MSMHCVSLFQSKQDVMRTQSERLNPPPHKVVHTREEVEVDECSNYSRQAIPWYLQALRLLIVIGLIQLTTTEWPKDVIIKGAAKYLLAQFVLIIMDSLFLLSWACIPHNNRRSLLICNIIIGTISLCKSCTVIFIICFRIYVNKIHYIIEPVIGVIVIFDAIAWKYQDKHFRKKYAVEDTEKHEARQRITRQLQRMFPESNSLDKLSKRAAGGNLTKVEFTKCQINRTSQWDTSVSNVGRVKGGLRVIYGRVRYYVSPEEYNVVSNKKPVLRARLSALQLENNRLNEEKTDTIALINRLQKHKGNEVAESQSRPQFPSDDSITDFSDNVQMKDYVELEEYRELTGEVDEMQAKVTSLAEENRLLSLGNRQLKDHLHVLLAEKAKSLPEDGNLNDVD